MTKPNDPLGYDTSDPDYIRKMARDALTGRNEDAVDAESAALRKAFGLKPRQPTRRQRLRRWMSHRYWRGRFLIEDRLS